MGAAAVATAAAAAVAPAAAAAAQVTRWCLCSWVAAGETAGKSPQLSQVCRSSAADYFYL